MVLSITGPMNPRRLAFLSKLRRWAPASMIPADYSHWAVQPTGDFLLPLPLARLPKVQLPSSVAPSHQAAVHQLQRIKLVKPVTRVPQLDEYTVYTYESLVAVAALVLMQRFILDPWRCYLQGESGGWRNARIYARDGIISLATSHANTLVRQQFAYSEQDGSLIWVAKGPPVGAQLAAREEDM